MKLKNWLMSIIYTTCSRLNVCSSGKAFGINYDIVWFKSRRRQLRIFCLKEVKNWLKSIIYIRFTCMNVWSSGKGFDMINEILWFKSRSGQLGIILLEMKLKIG